MKRIKYIVVCIVALMVAQQVHAGFPIGKQRWLLVPTFNHYAATSYWDDSRTLKDFNPSARFVSNYFGLYGGYGINRDWEIVFKLPYIANRYVTSGYLEQTSGIGDVNVGVTYYLNHFDYYRHLSITGTLILPFYSNDTTVSKHTLLGYGTVGLEAKIGYAGTNQNFLKNTFYDLEGGVRQYLSSQGPSQFFTNLTFGVPLDDNWKISGTLRGVISSSPYGNLFNSGYVTPLVNRDFDYLRFEVAAGVKATRSTSIWASLYTDIMGRHIGQGSGYSLFAVIKF